MSATIKHPLSVRLVLKTELDRLREIAITSYVHTFGAVNTAENMTAYLEEAFNPAQIEKELDEKNTRTYFVLDKDQAIGFARLRTSSEVDYKLGENSLELQRLYILPDYKGKKAGSALMKEIIGYARNQKFDWLWLGVWERNFDAQQFYTKWGFEKFDEHIFQMGDDPQTDWLLKLKL